MKTIAEFMETDCQLLKPIMIFIGIHQATNGNPCTTGCAYFDDGKCSAYRQLFKTPIKQPVQPQSETVKEMALRLGISVSEMRKRRRLQ